MKTIAIMDEKTASIALVFLMNIMKVTCFSGAVCEFLSSSPTTSSNLLSLAGRMKKTKMQETKSMPEKTKNVFSYPRDP